MMRELVRLPALLLAVLPVGTAWSSDACSSLAIHTKADVAVSDGSSFQTESWYLSRDAAAIRHLKDDARLTVAEGPTSWTSDGTVESIGSGFHGHFAVGHQFHALLLDFEANVDDAGAREAREIRGERYDAVTGVNPRGGSMSLLFESDSPQPAGLAIDIPDTDTILVTFHDWRGEKTPLPYHARIDDGERVFDYRYSHVDVSEQSPLWFYEAVPAPNIDAVQVYRLHRKLLAAHCLGDAELMAELSAPTTVVASRGDIVEPTRESMRERFTSVFERVNYESYVDLKPPIIRIADSGDIGWITVNVRARGSVHGSDASFDDQWAWIMLVEKIDGVWRHAGNASNHRERPDDAE